MQDDENPNTIESTVREMISNAGTVWHELQTYYSDDGREETVDLTPLVELESNFIGRFKEMFKEARQEAYNLGLQDAQLLIDWDAMWNDALSWLESLNSKPDHGVLLKDKVKELILKQMREKSK